MAAEVPAKPKKQRAAKPKVSTGCVTCKQRRIKCGEEKPNCMRCVKTGRECGGYIFKTPRSSSRRVLLPKSLETEAGNSTSSSLLPHSRSPTSSRSSTLFSADSSPSNQVQYPHHGGLKVSDLINGNDGPMLRQLGDGQLNSIRVLECDEDDDILETISSNCSVVSHSTSGSSDLEDVWNYSHLTSMFANDEEHRYFQFFCDSTAREFTGFQNNNTWTTLIPQACHDEPFVKHAVIALAALNKTIHAARSATGGKSFDFREGTFDSHHKFALQHYSNAIRQMALAEGENIRTTLIGCLLVVCFETLHGNIESSLSHLRSGLVLFQQWLSQHQHPQKRLIGVASPAPHIVEDSLFHCMSRLDIQQMTYHDTRSIEIHHSMKNEGQETVQCMPARFSDLATAGIYWQLLHRRIDHFKKTVTARVGGQPSPASLANLADLADSLSQKECHSRDLQRWYNAFEPLYSACINPNRVPNQTSNQDFIDAILLRLSWNMSKLFLAERFFMQSSSYDIMHTEFTEITTLSRTLISHPDYLHLAGRAVFNFDMTIICPLYFVANRCRHRGLRKEAVGLLLQSARREGLWDSTFAGSVTRWQMETEELYLRPEEEYVPEEARVTILGVKITLEEHMAEVRYRQGPQGATSPSTSTTTSSIGSGGVSRASTMMGEKRIYNNNERQAIVRW